MPQPEPEARPPPAQVRQRRRLGCPTCAGAVRRSRRSTVQRWFSGDTGDIARYRCTDAGCGWTGFIDRSGIQPKPTPRLGLLRVLRSVVPLALAAAAVAFASWGASKAPVASVGVGTRQFAPGEVFDGETLPAGHPLLLAGLSLPQAEVPQAAGSRADEASAHLPPADHAAGTSLGLRRFCAWGSPGRMPYRGTVDEALHAAQIPTAVRQQIVAAVATGHASERLTIANDGIRALSSGREFDPRRFAMSYGRTLCLGTRVNFKPGHVEPASLFEAQDLASGRLYSVMVPDICRNVSILSRRPAVRPGPDRDPRWLGPANRGIRATTARGPRTPP